MRTDHVRQLAQAAHGWLEAEAHGDYTEDPDSKTKLAFPEWVRRLCPF